MCLCACMHLTILKQFFCMFCDLYMCRNNLKLSLLNFCKGINKLSLTLFVLWNVGKYSYLIVTWFDRGYVWTRSVVFVPKAMDRLGVRVLFTSIVLKDRLYFIPFFTQYFLLLRVLCYQQNLFGF